MFLHLLADEQQSIFTRLAHSMIRVDGVIHEREEALDGALAREIGTLPEGETQVTAREIAQHFDTRPAARVLVIELAGIALADEHLDEAELQLLEQTASAAGLSQREVNGCLDFVQRAHQLIAEGTLLILEDAAEPEATFPAND